MVIDYFKGQKKEIAELGKKMLADHLESLGYRMNNDTIGILINHFSIPGGNVEEMFFRIGIGTVKLGADLPEVLASGKADRSHSWSFPWFGKKRMSVKKENDGYTIASCCRPIPGDPVIGIKSPDGTVTVHKKSCPVADSIASKHGDWWLSRSGRMTRRSLFRRACPSTVLTGSVSLTRSHATSRWSWA